MIDLKPCPFCGSEARMAVTAFEGPTEYAVVCDGCRLIIGYYGKNAYGKCTNLYYQTREEAADAWNRRVKE